MTTIKQWKSRLEEAAYFSQEDYENDKLHFMQAEIDELRAENARLRKLLEDCQYALEYAADMTKPEGLSGCDCPICTTTIALHKELGEK